MPRKSFLLYTRWKAEVCQNFGINIVYFKHKFQEYRTRARVSVVFTLLQAIYLYLEWQNSAWWAQPHWKYSQDLDPSQKRVDCAQKVPFGKQQTDLSSYSAPCHLPPCWIISHDISWTMYDVELIYLKSAVYPLLAHTIFQDGGPRIGCFQLNWYRRNPTSLCANSPSRGIL